jgi:hypothetical protein
MRRTTSHKLVPRISLVSFMFPIQYMVSYKENRSPKTLIGVLVVSHKKESLGHNLHRFDECGPHFYDSLTLFLFIGINS